MPGADAAFAISPLRVDELEPVSLRVLLAQTTWNEFNKLTKGGSCTGGHSADIRGVRTEAG